ncbi:MAG: hypothetical protein ACI93R_003679 [Flavobacteriales bacterium]|jgi:hypothetical protein
MSSRHLVFGATFGATLTAFGVYFLALGLINSALMLTGLAVFSVNLMYALRSQFAPQYSAVIIVDKNDKPYKVRSLNNRSYAD